MSVLFIARFIGDITYIRHVLRPVQDYLPSLMSTATAEPPKKSQSKSKTKEKRQGQTKASGTERLKIIVRRLPPHLPEQIFWQSVQPWVTDDTVLWKEFYPGKSRKR